MHILSPHFRSVHLKHHASPCAVVIGGRNDFSYAYSGGRGILKCDGSEEGTYKKAHTCVNQLGERSVGSVTGSLLPFVRKHPLLATLYEANIIHSTYFFKGGG